MQEYELLHRLAQEEIIQCGEIFRDFLRLTAQEAIVRVFKAEVEELCGVSHHRSNKLRDYYRAGSTPGSVLHEGRKIKLKRPRVRKRKGVNKSEEVDLRSYLAAREPGELNRMLFRALAGNVPSRRQKQVYPYSPKTSKSSISRLFMREGARIFAEFRNRDICRDDWLVLTMDGIHLAKDLWAIVALGVAEDGTKHMLDFAVGASENTKVATALVNRLFERNFAPKQDCCLFCLFDGSKALRKATKKQWSDAIFQRCLAHKERNLRSVLSKRDWGEVARLLKRIRNVQGKEAGSEALAELRKFVAGRNANALNQLDEAGQDLISLHLLGVPNTLHRNLLSTNIIENSIRNVRGTIGRVNRWRPETDQPRRWLALALTEIEKGFQRLAGV